MALRAVRRWWLAAVLLNVTTALPAAAAALLLPRASAAWFGLPALFAASLLPVPLLLGRRRTRRRLHRARPETFPPGA